VANVEDDLNLTMGHPMFVQTLDCLPETYAERRRASRRQPAHDTLCRLIELDGDQIGCGLVWNISASGVSMLLNLRLEPGAVIGAELARPGAPTVRVGLTVIHASRLRTGDYIVGGQFGRCLGAGELQPFTL
jgi:hypothetical protein